MTVQAPVGGLVLSVVSHGHGAQVEHLLHALARLRSPVLVRVVLTQNSPEPTPVAPAGGWPFAFELRSNREPLGFGANHNRALAGALEAWVGVLNPDVQWEAGDPFAAMVTAAVPGVGCVYPVQTDRLGRAVSCPNGSFRGCKIVSVNCHHRATSGGATSDVESRLVWTGSTPRAVFSLARLGNPWAASTSAISCTARTWTCACGCACAAGRSRGRQPRSSMMVSVPAVETGGICAGTS